MTITRAGGLTPSSSSHSVAHRTGTFRSATAEQMTARLRPMLDRFGITRVADLTRLDEIGLPVHIAYRPCGRTLSVSVGAGTEPRQAWVSAVMESIEAWHGENPRLPVVERAPARALGLPYDVRSLNLAERSLLSPLTVLDWVLGHSVLSGQPVLVPLGLIELDSTRRVDRHQTLFNITSNGLATGNTRTEAILHGLFEVIERDCCTPFTELPLTERSYVDLDSVTHPVPSRILALLRQADCHVELSETTNEMGIPSYACAIWSVDVPIFFSGFGCHLESDLAVTRALLEAVLSRLATISGARDDIDEFFYRNADPLAKPTLAGRDLRPVGTSAGPRDSVESAIRFCAEQIMKFTGTEPIFVDLTQDDIEIPAVKVIAPGLRMFNDAAVASRPRS